MISFNADKTKKISVAVDSYRGIDPSKMNYRLRMDINEMELGFKGVYNKGTITFEIPPLYSILGESVDDTHSIRIEVDDGNKIFMALLKETAKFKSDPQVKLTTESITEENVDDDESLEVKIVEESNKDPEDTSHNHNHQTIKNTKLIKFLTD